MLSIKRCPKYPGTCPYVLGTSVALFKRLLLCQKAGAAVFGIGAALLSPLLLTLRTCPKTRNPLLRFHSTRTYSGNPCLKPFRIGAERLGTGKT